MNVAKLIGQVVVVAMAMLIFPALWAQSPQGNPAWRMQRVEIVDRSGFERPLVASTMLVPAGWQTQGGIIWNPQNPCGTGYNVQFQAVAPGGSSALQILPMERWQWNTMGAGNQSIPGCPMAQITSIQQYLQEYVQRSRPGANILDFRLRGDIAESLKALNSVTSMPMGETRSWVEAAEVLIGYSYNGDDTRETIAVAAVFNLMHFASSYGMPAMDYLSGATLPGFAMRAPDGQLDFRFAEMIRKSAKGNPEWTARINKHERKIANINIKGARDRAQITAKTNQEISQMQRDSWDLYQRSSDRNSRETSEWIRGVETFDDPYHGGTVELDNTYQYHYQLENGDYIMTDDANFNPYQSYGMSANRLEVTQ